MSFLAKSRKADLIVLADELGLNVPANPKILQLVELIKQADGFDEDLVKDLLASITAQREEQEKLELNDKKAEREFNLQKLEIEKKSEHEFEIAKTKFEQEFELQKLQIEKNSDRESKQLELGIASTSKQNFESVAYNNKHDILKLMTRFEMKSDISVYLSLFERQIKRVGVLKEDWVVYLLGLLPLEIVNLIAREPDSTANDYDHIRQLLLKRFKMSPEQFRQKFSTHRKDISESWRDYAFELNNFLEEWVTGLNVVTYDELKELLVVDQIRRKLPNEIKEHFLDTLPKFKTTEALVSSLEDYESARNNIKRIPIQDAKNPYQKDQKRIFHDSDRNKFRSFNRAQFDNNTYRLPKNQTNIKTSPKSNSKCFVCGQFSHQSSECPRKKEGPICFRCLKPGHYQKSCDLKDVNSAASNNPILSSGKITKTVEIFGKKINALVDTGSDVSMVSHDFYLEIQCPKILLDNVKLSGIGGSEITPLGYFNVDLCIEEHVVNVNIYVMKELDNDLIIGNNVISKFNIVLSETGLKIIGKRFNSFNPNKINVNYAVISNKPAIAKIGQSNSCDIQQHADVIIKNVSTPIEKENKLPSYEVQSITNASFPICLSSTGGNLNRSRQSVHLEEESLSPIRNSSGGSQSIPRSIKCELQRDSRNTSQLVYFSETIDAINLSEVEFEHITDRHIRQDLQLLVTNYQPVKTKNTCLQLSLVLTDEVPIVQRPRRLAFSEQNIVELQIHEWLSQGIIRESCSNYASPIVLVKKKNGSHRLCIDYRKLNKKIIRDHYPLPLIEEVIDKVQQSNVFTSLDLKNGFFHVDVAEDSKKYTSFVTHNGQFEFNKVPFGLSVSPQIFQRYICTVFKELIRDGTLLIYMDDVIIPAQSEEESLEKLKRVLKVASEYGLEFNFPKCQFLKRRIEFLGYVIEKGTIRPSEVKTAAVKKFPEPKNVRQLQSFLGLTGYFRKYIEGYAKIAKPLSDLLKQNSNFEFGPTQKEAFQTLKDKLADKPVLHIFKRGSRLELHTDASSLGFGAILFQHSDDGKLHPIHYMSRKTTPTQEKYCSYELEVLAIVEAFKKFRNYLLGTKVKIVTDCAAFQKTLDKKELSPKVARWTLFLQEFDYEIVHRAGKQMQHVDALSRNTVLLVTRSYDEITATIANAQAEDDYIQTIKKLIELNKSEEYLIKNNIVYKYHQDRELLMVPEGMQQQIIREIHNKGHYAIAKTEAIVKQDFYIPHLRKQIERVISNCIECILCNRKQGKGEGLLNPIPKQNIPLNTYHIDFIGPMPSTNKNYNHIFTVVDAFTKFVWLYPVKTTSAKEAIDKLTMQQNIFGNPSRIISDKGAAFTSHEFLEYCKNEDIEHITITTGIPRGNGQIERMHETLIPILSKLSIDDHTKWYKYVTKVQRIMNSTAPRSTQFTPFELLTGVKLRDKTDVRIKSILDEEYVRTIMKERTNIRDMAKENILKIQQENVRSFNKKRKRAPKYRLGEIVAIRKTQFGTGMKLRPKFHGPYKITKVNMNDRYEVEKVGCHDGPTFTSSAADHMKPWSSSG